MDTTLPTGKIYNESEKQIFAKVTKRLVPFLVFLFLLAWIDRVNVGFAKLAMLKDLGFSETAYGLGAGIFFIGYFLFEVPSNLLLEKIGARLTLARITILWGFTSILMAYVKTEMMFYVVRFFLGVFEAGFFPGVVLYLTYWFPSSYRAKINGLFMTSFAIAGIVGGPIAGLIMNSMVGNIGGHANWQWLFILEGIPSILAGIAVLYYLPEKPNNAKFLTQSEKEFVNAQVMAENNDGNKHASLKALFSSGKIWLCALIYFCIVSGNATIAFWTPSVVQALGISNNFIIGLISAIPFIAGTIAMVLNGYHSDKTQERKWHCAIATLVAALGLIGTGVFMGNIYFAMFSLTIAAVGILAAFPVFWSIPNMFLASTAAAGGIAFINSLGNLAGFAAPYAMGFLKTSTGSLSSGLYFVAFLEFMAFALVLVIFNLKNS